MSDKSKIYDYIKRTINPYGKPFEGTAYELGLKIMDYIENMDDEKENGWIPVSEGLPDPDQYIAIALDNCDTPAIGRYTVDDEGGGTFRVGDQNESFLELNLIVNAWAPLPKLYKKVRMGKCKLECPDGEAKCCIYCEKQDGCDSRCDTMDSYECVEDCEDYVKEG